MSGADHRDEAPAFRAAFAKMDLAGAEESVRASLRHELDALVERVGGRRGRRRRARWRSTAGSSPRSRASSSASIHGIRASTRSAALLRASPRVGGGGPRLAARRSSPRSARFATIAREVGSRAPRGFAAIAPGTALALLVDADAAVARAAGARGELRADLPDRVERPDRALRLDLPVRDRRIPTRSMPVRAHGRSPGGPRQGPPVDPATAFVMETLRLEQSEFLYRRVVAPIDIDGRTIPAGWILRLCVNEAHRDPAVFPDPDRFDPRRFLAAELHAQRVLALRRAHARLHGRAPRALPRPHPGRGTRARATTGPSSATGRSSAAAAIATTGGRAPLRRVAMRAAAPSSRSRPDARARSRPPRGRGSVESRAWPSTRDRRCSPSRT